MKRIEEHGGLRNEAVSEQSWGPLERRHPKHVTAPMNMHCWEYLFRDLSISVGEHSFFKSEG